MRLIWTRTAGLPRPLTNRPVFDLQGRHIGTPDLLDVEAGLFGEYDGAMHLDGKSRLRGLVHEDRFTARSRRNSRALRSAQNFIEPSRQNSR